MVFMSLPAIVIRGLPITIIARSVVIVAVVSMQDISYVTLQPDDGVDEALITVEV